MCLVCDLQNKYGGELIRIVVYQTRGDKCAVLTKLCRVHRDKVTFRAQLPTGHEYKDCPFCELGKKTEREVCRVIWRQSFPELRDRLFTNACAYHREGLTFRKTPPK